jgi:hypothetical protein
MKQIRETPAAADIDAPPPDPAGAPPIPSPDQRFYDESLRASVRSLGRVIQGRRKTER